ncbi:hypothetical protein K439DRAFT_1665578 [Ramaria rubella]|nr:hypothetical protein K439DRAFT_1665578 [Ramaria rubella]
MSDAECSEVNTPISPTLSVEELWMGNVDATTSTLSFFSRSSTTKSHWVSGRISGKVLQALGPSTANLVTRLIIKKRLSSIDSQINIRLHINNWHSASNAFSKEEVEQFSVAYDDLVDLSSGYYSAKITTQAISLRLTLLRLFIESGYSCLETHWEHHTLRNLWAELDELAAAQNDHEIRNTASDLKRALITKLTDELSTFNSEVITDGPFHRQTRIHMNDLGVLLAGTHIVHILCQDLAYGTGAYAVQSALHHIARSSWGAAQLKRLNCQGTLILDCTRRLLIDFDNVYSIGMAFTIFGGIASMPSEGSPGGLSELLSGAYGLESLITTLRLTLEGFTSINPFHIERLRLTRVLCTSLLSACCHGFIKKVVQLGTCSFLAELVDTFSIRDSAIQETVEDDGVEDIDIENAQIAAFKLILELTEDKEALHYMREAGLGLSLITFGTHSNRMFSRWSLQLLVSTIRDKLR